MHTKISSQDRLKSVAKYGALLVVFLFGIVSIIASSQLPPMGGWSAVQVENQIASYERRIEDLTQEKVALTNRIQGQTGSERAATQEHLDEIDSEIEGLQELIEDNRNWLDAITREKDSETETCFPADTLVLTEDGAKYIGDIKMGDKVLTADEKGALGSNRVVKTYESTNNHYYFFNGKIKVTALHRFFTTAGWKKARELQIGDLIQTSTGVFEKIVSKERVATDLRVHNLEVADNHNFFVSPDGKTGYLVHNTGGGGGK